MIQIRKNINLAKFTTFKIGGPASYFCIAKNEKDLNQVLLWAKKNKTPFFILGNGSNLLVSDEGYRGLVIKFQAGGCKITDGKVFCGAGAGLGEISNFFSKNSLTGFEWAAGIPGTLGGAIFGSAGAFGKSMKDIILDVQVLDVKIGKIINLKNKNCGFGYRKSVFKKKNNLIIISANLKGISGKEIEIKNKMKEYLTVKKERQPLSFSSAGSVFKNPPKFSAGELIEKCELKGKIIGGAQISPHHANFILNLQKASAKDVMALINLIKKSVKNKFGLKLNEEIIFLGF
jgi:UDP-N-acetylmuramate dehydrogenase